MKNDPTRRTIFTIFLTLPLLFALSSCMERNADIDSPQPYAVEGLSFNYPGNWEVTEDSKEDLLRYLFVETPGDAILIIQIFPKSLGMELPEFANRFVDSMAEQLPVGELVDVDFSPLESLTDCERLKETFAIKLLGEHVAHSREYRKYDFEDSLIYVISQVENSDLKKVSPGFKMIHDTLGFVPGS